MSTNSLLKYDRNIREGLSHSTAHKLPQYTLARANQVKPMTFKAKHGYYMGDIHLLYYQASRYRVGVSFIS